MPFTINIDLHLPTWYMPFPYHPWENGIFTYTWMVDIVWLIMWVNMGVSRNRGIPKWMVKITENPVNPWMIWGGKPHYFGNIHIPFFHGSIMWDIDVEGEVWNLRSCLSKDERAPWTSGGLRRFRRLPWFCCFSMTWCFANEDGELASSTWFQMVH